MTMTMLPGHDANGFLIERAAGVLLATACGDALGVPYEFARRLGEGETPEMVGGGLGPYAPGEYSDDTQMAVCLAQAALEHPDMGSSAARRKVARAWLRWRREGASDIGAQTSSVLGAAEQAGTDAVDQAMFEAARQRYQKGVPSAGNGSLMRTAPLALSYLQSPQELARVAAMYSALTHADPLATEACVLWCEGIRHGVVNGDFRGVRAGLRLLREDRRAQWEDWLDEAESAPPHTFANNGFVVTALQAAWSAITRTPVPEERPEEGSFAADHARLALQAAVRAGNDTDTVAAIAGGLLGARWGASAIPWQYQRGVHGWPGLRARDLMALGARIVAGVDRNGWPTADRQPRLADARRPFAAAHPHDPGVILGNLALADAWSTDVDAVVSLCRVGLADFAEVARDDHAQIWLVDVPGANAHLHYTLDQAARAVAGLRAEGKRVLLHCAAGRSRTPAVAARYSTLTQGVPALTALREIMAATAANQPALNPEFEDALCHLNSEPAPARRRPFDQSPRPPMGHNHGSEMPDPLFDL